MPNDSFSCRLVFFSRPSLFFFCTVIRLKPIHLLYRSDPVTCHPIADRCMIGPRSFSIEVKVEWIVPRHQTSRTWWDSHPPPRPTCSSPTRRILFPLSPVKNPVGALSPVCRSGATYTAGDDRSGEIGCGHSGSHADRAAHDAGHTITWYTHPRAKDSGPDTGYHAVP